MFSSNDLKSLLHSHFVPTSKGKIIGTYISQKFHVAQFWNVLLSWQKGQILLDLASWEGITRVNESIYFSSSMLGLGEALHQASLMVRRHSTTSIMSSGDVKKSTPASSHMEKNGTKTEKQSKSAWGKVVNIPKLPRILVEIRQFTIIAEFVK